MFLGWHDGDKHKPVSEKVEEALDRYVEKFDSQPETILCSFADEATVRKVVGERCEVRPATFLHHDTFYVGVEDVGPNCPSDGPTATKAANDG